MKPETLRGRITFRTARYDAESRTHYLMALVIADVEGNETNVILATDNVPALSWHTGDEIEATGLPRVNQYEHAELIDATIIHLS